jgi:CPA2 family monovalent cation:H+ antiporter-2
MHDDVGLLANLAICFGIALALGLLTQRMKLSPIVGYLLAGIVVGPHSPGFVADTKTAAELAEIGVVLLMFGVGMHFDLRDLLAVRRIAIPGAIAQIVVATTLGVVATYFSGMNAAAGIVVGFAVAVASTVVVIRVLMDNDLLESTQGHIAVGWLIVQDIFCVLILVAMPAFADAFSNDAVAKQNIFLALGLAILKVCALGFVVVVGGRSVIPWLLRQVARTRSRELFTLTILAIAMAIATGSAALFGVSMALGAFLAGVVVGQTEVSHQAASDALPMRDAFAVLFFVSVGMLFDPQVVIERPGTLLSLLAIVLVANPLTAFFVVWILRFTVQSAFTVAVALAQIGEFSFLLADEAMKESLLPPEGHSLLVGCAILSMALNPLLFRGIRPIEQTLRKWPWFWSVLSRRSEQGGLELNESTRVRLNEAELAKTSQVTAVIVGYGPVGQAAFRILKEFDIKPVVIDLNLDTIKDLVDAGEFGVYGDAARTDILEAAGIRKAKYLLATIPAVLGRTVVTLAAKELNPELRVFVRARYIQEQAWLEEVGATKVVTEEAETAIGLAVLLLREVGADENRIQKEITRIQEEHHT